MLACECVLQAKVGSFLALTVLSQMAGACSLHEVHALQHCLAPPPIPPSSAVIRECTLKQECHATLDIVPSFSWPCRKHVPMSHTANTMHLHLHLPWWKPWNHYIFELRQCNSELQGLLQLCTHACTRTSARTHAYPHMLDVQAL